MSVDLLYVRNLYIAKVVGVDFGGRLIDSAIKAKKTGKIEFLNGKCQTSIKIDETIDREKVTFLQV